ncbi:MAG: flagellar export protein FliJ [Lachnospiraceae bacterium]
MKRFKYSLETVLDYKNQVLDNLKQEHAEITRSVNEKREEIHHLERTMDDYQAEFDETKSAGAPIESFRLYNICIERMGKIIEEEKEHLVFLEEKQEKKKIEVVEAKVDTSKIEKLKGKKLQEYRKAELKEEEAFAEETAVRMMSAER